MHNDNCSMERLAFPIDEIFQSNVDDEENKLIIEFFKNVKREKENMPDIVCSTKQIEAKEKEGKYHELCLIIDDYNTRDIIGEKENAIYNKQWQNHVCSYLMNLRNYIHKIYNRKVINEEMYKNCDCFIFLSLENKEHLVKTFQTKPICLHLYLYGINYKQVVFYIGVVTQYISTWHETVDNTEASENSERLNFSFFLWIVYLLILLDSLQAIDAEVASNLQVIKRFCLKKIKESTNDCNISDCSIWDSLVYFHCKSNKDKWKLLPLNCPTLLFYVIYLMITRIFNQK